MKRTVAILGVVSLLCLGAAGCAAPYSQIALQTPMPMVTPPPTLTTDFTPAGEDSLAVVGEYSPYALPASLRSGSVFSTALYKQLLDAAAAGQADVGVDENQLTQEQIDAVRSYVLTRGRIKYLTDITQEDGKLTLKFSTEDMEQVKAASASFDSFAKELLQGAAKAGMSNLECAMALYQELSQNVEYSYDALDDTLYGAIVDHEGAADGYAYAYGFLLDQLGIQNLYVTSEDGTHVWNLLTIDGVSYHVDLTFNASLSIGQSMKFFGMSDNQVTAALGHNSWSGSDGVNEQLVPVCSSERFKALWDADRSDVDYVGHGVFLDGYDGLQEIMRFDIATGDVLSYLPMATDGFVVLNSKLYYINPEDSGLYAVDLQSGETGALQEGVKVVSLQRKGDMIYYGVENETALRSLEAAA